MKIQIKRRDVYGNQLIYPCNFIQELQGLTKKKTLDKNDLENLRRLGHIIYDCDAEIEKILATK